MRLSTLSGAPQLDPDRQTLVFTVNVDFEAFPALAQQLCEGLDVQVIERNCGADRHQWRVEFEGSPLWFNYEYYSGSAWFSCQMAADYPVLQYLKTLWESQA